MRRTHNWVLIYHFYLAGRKMLSDNKMNIDKSSGVPISLQMSVLYLPCDDAYAVATDLKAVSRQQALKLAKAIPSRVVPFTQNFCSVQLKRCACCSMYSDVPCKLYYR